MTSRDDEPVPTPTAPASLERVARQWRIWARGYDYQVDWSKHLGAWAGRAPWKEPPVDVDDELSEAALIQRGVGTRPLDP